MACGGHGAGGLATMLLALLGVCTAVAAQSPSLEGSLPPPLRFRAYPPMPVYPEPGKKFSLEVYVWSRMNETTATTKLNFFANLTGPGSACAANQPPDASINVPPLQPFQVKRFKVKVPAPDTLGRAVLRWCLEGVGNVDGDNLQGYDYEVTTVKAPALGIVPSDPIAYYKTQMSPEHPVIGQSFTMSFGIVNYGTAPTLTNTTLAVWGASPDLVPPCGGQASSPPNVVLQLPKVGPGATYSVKDMELASPNYGGYNWAMVMVDWPSCNTLSPIVQRYNVEFSYDTAGAPMPSFTAQSGEPKTSAYRITTSPRSLKAGGTMAIKLKAINTGDVDGKLGMVYAWITKFNGTAGRFVEPGIVGQRCNWSGYAASADLTSGVVAPGKAKRVSIPDVPVPSEPGEYYVAVVFDGTCLNPYSLAGMTFSTRSSYYSAFLVKP